MGKLKLLSVLLSMILTLGFLNGSQSESNVNEAAVACWYMANETSGGTSAIYGSAAGTCATGSLAGFYYYGWGAAALAKAGVACASSGVGLGVGIVLGL